MDALLQTLGVQTFNYAIRSGIALTSKYALQQGVRLLKSVNDKSVRAELTTLQKLLDNKIKILSPALDLIEFKSGRGNVFLESAVPLAKSLHREIVRLGKRLENAAAAEEKARRGRSIRGTRLSEAHHAELLLIIRDIKDLLGRIDRDIPLLQLAITASGEKMSTAMTPGISPSRMMQASALLSFADAHFAIDPSHPMQVGPSFTLSLYMLFLGHSQVGSGPGTGGAPMTPPGSTDEARTEAPYGLGEGERKPIWQEVMHKARLRLCRTPPDWAFDPTQGYRPNGACDLRHRSVAGPETTLPRQAGHFDGYSYHLELIEDLDDGRLHDGDGPKRRPYDNIPMAGIRESVPIHQIAKLFYTDTGRILNIGNNDERDNNPVLLLKRDVNAKSPIRMRQEWFDGSESGQSEPHSDASAGPSECDEQDEVNQQLWEETEGSAGPTSDQHRLLPTYLPPHLDPEWLALEVYVDDASDGDGDGNGSDEDDGDGSDSDTETPRRTLPTNAPKSGDRPPMECEVMARIRHMSIQGESPVQDLLEPHAADLQKPQVDVAESYTNRSPFGAITSSLSLLEMLIRLTSLQEFQQTPHLAIPDHILTFFLEETSTTGLQGEARWRMRSEAKRRMGFDPYTDTPQRQSGE